MNNCSHPNCDKPSTCWILVTGLSMNSLLYGCEVHVHGVEKMFSTQVKCEELTFHEALIWDIMSS